jgi:TorA-specific chaperone
MKMERPKAATSADNDWNALIAEWLAGLYLGPLATDTVHSFRNGPGAVFLDALAFQPECSAGAKRMRSILLAGDDPAEVARKLSIEFSLLFEGPGGPRTVSLYESAYSGALSLLFQAATSDMNELLRQADASVRLAVKEPADHLSVELALFARMMRENASSRVQSELLDLHLLMFTPIFAARCFEADRSGFYIAAADLMIGFLRERRAALAHRLDSSTLPVGSNEFEVARSVDHNVSGAPL